MFVYRIASEEGTFFIKSVVEPSAMETYAKIYKKRRETTDMHGFLVFLTDEGIHWKDFKENFKKIRKDVL